MTDDEAARITRENAYLKQRCAQLQSDVTDLGAEVSRMRQEMERVMVRRAARPADPLSGGQ